MWLVLRASTVGGELCSRTSAVKALAVRGLPAGSFALCKMQPEIRDPGAACLDGSPAGFHFRPNRSQMGGQKWIIHLAGGGWCYDELSCSIRASSLLGSSGSYRSTYPGDWQGGIFSYNCTQNPTFCGFNQVQVIYCDGSSFSGDRDDAVLFNGSRLYFRGKRNLYAALSRLLASYDLDAGNEVLFTGDSAGGLAVLLHGDAVKSYLERHMPRLWKFRLVALSGMFLDHENLVGERVMGYQMRHIQRLAHWLPSKECTDKLNPGGVLEEACNWAFTAYGVLVSPTFVVNSALDLYQTSCFLAGGFMKGYPNREVQSVAWGNCSAFPDWSECATDIFSCAPEQVPTMNRYMRRFRSALNSSPTFAKPGNGAFITSCNDHDAAMASDRWMHQKIGGVSMQEAVLAWWESGAGLANHIDHCYWTASTPHTCNPSCTKWSDPALH